MQGRCANGKAERLPRVVTGKRSLPHEDTRRLRTNCSFLFVTVCRSLAKSYIGIAARPMWSSRWTPERILGVAASWMSLG